MTKTKETIARAAEVRRLLSLGVTPKEIAQRLGMTLNNVYGIRAYDRMRLRKEFLLGIPTPTPEPTLTPKKKLGRPKGSKNKKVVSVDKTTLLELDRNRLKDELFDTKELNEQLIRSLQEATTPKIVYREVPVPQPFSHYSFWQRLGILFFGRAA